METDFILHICPARDWETAQRLGEYCPASLELEGFIHFSRREQVLRVANHFYRGHQELVLLWVDPSRLSASLLWEPVGGDTFPHLYGPLNLDAVSAVTPFPCDNHGVFHRLITPEA
jgi:uncharacterized protein (DUF952 family)